MRCPMCRPRSTICRPRARTSNASRSWSRGSAETCARSISPSRPRSIPRSSRPFRKAGQSPASRATSRPSSRRSAAGRRLAARRRTQSVTHLIQELNARGLKVTLYPFVMMDIPAGNGLADPYTGTSSQPAYPWRGRITCDPAPGSWFAGRHRRGRDADRCVLRRRRSRRVGLSPHGAALRAACRGCGRRRCIPHRLGAARPHARALGERRLSGGHAAHRVGRRCEGDPRLGDDRHLWRRLDRVRRACGRSERERSALSARCVVGVIVDRRGRHRLLRAARGLARWRRASRQADRAVDLRTRLSRRQSARRRCLRLVLRRRCGARCANAHADHRRARQALGVSRQGYLELVEQPALRARRRRRAWRADGMDAAEQADLAHRDRLPGGRQGSEPAQRVSGSEVLGSQDCRISRPASATT